MFATLDAARSTGHAAAEACAVKADRLDPGWIESAVEALRRFARNQQCFFTIEAARGVIEYELPPVHEKRAWGRVTQVAVQREFIARVKGGYAPAASSNGSEKPLYRKGVKA